MLLKENERKTINKCWSVQCLQLIVYRRFEDRKATKSPISTHMWSIRTLSFSFSFLFRGGFLLVGNPISNDLAGFDFRETAPSGSSANMFANNPQAAVQVRYSPM